MYYNKDKYIYSNKEVYSVMKHNYLEPRADIRFLMSGDIIANSEEPFEGINEPEKEPADDTIEDNFS